MIKLYIGPGPHLSTAQRGVCGSGFGVHSLGSDLGLRVYGLRFRAEGLG